MTDEKISARSNQVLVQPGTPGYQTEVTVGDADEKPGMIVTGAGETHPEVDLCASGESLFGVLLNHSDLDIDTAFTATEGAKGVPCARMHTGAHVWGFMMATSATCVAGAPLAVASEDGKWTPYAADLPGSAYSETSGELQLMIISDGFGYIMEDYTQDNTDDQVVEVLL